MHRPASHSDCLSAGRYSHPVPPIRPTDGLVCQAAASAIDIDSFFISSR